MHEFRMPSLGADMDAGTLVEWMVKPGDEVRRGQVVAVVETQKGAIEVEIWEDGTVDRLMAGTGKKVPVGDVLALVREPGEPAGEGSAPPDSAAVAYPVAAVAPPVAAVAPPVAAVAPPVAAAPTALRIATRQPATPPAEATERARVSPAARRLAAELKIDIGSIVPAEPGGVVSLADVERAAKARGSVPQPPAGPAGDWHAQMRQAIAAAMSRSKREIPHYYLATDIDVTDVTSWLVAENLKRDVVRRLLPVVPLMKAVALALREVPEMNGFFTPDGFKPSPAVHLGMAIAMRGGGLVAPAIHDADKLGLDDMMAALRDLVARVRGGRLRSSEMSDPTATLTNLGDQGVEMVLPVIYPPQVAIVGLGRVTDRPRAVGDAIVARKVVSATLAADHRASDGHCGALFLAALGRLLGDPEKLQ